MAKRKQQISAEVARKLAIHVIRRKSAQFAKANKLVRIEEPPEWAEKRAAKAAQSAADFEAAKKAFEEEMASASKARKSALRKMSKAQQRLAKYLGDDLGGFGCRAGAVRTLVRLIFDSLGETLPSLPPPLPVGPAEEDAGEDAWRIEDDEAYSTDDFDGDPLHALVIVQHPEWDTFGKGELITVDDGCGTLMTMMEGLNIGGELADERGAYRAPTDEEICRFVKRMRTVDIRTEFASYLTVLQLQEEGVI